MRPHPDAYEIRQPIIVHSRADIASLLRAHRMARGWTCHEHDHRAGFHDGYTAKLEHGDAKQGRQGFRIDPATDRLSVSHCAEVWLETLGVRMVLMPADMAEAIGAVPAPARERAA